MNKLSKITILYHLINFTKNITVSLGVLQLSRGNNLLAAIAMIVIALNIIGGAHRIFKVLYGFEWETQKNSLFVKSGIFFKKTIEVDNDKIISVQSKQPYYLKPSHLFEIKITLNSNISSTIKFQLISEKDKLKLEEKEVKVQSHEVSKTPSYKVSYGRVVKSSLLTLNYLYIVSLGFLLQDVLDKLKLKINLVTYTLNIWEKHRVLCIIIFVVASVVSAIIKQFKDFANFKVFVEEDHLLIKNGIAISQTIKISLQDIVGIRIKQSIGQRINRLWSLELMVKNLKLSKENQLVREILPFATKKTIGFSKNTSLNLNYDINLLFRRQIANLI